MLPGRLGLQLVILSRSDSYQGDNGGTQLIYDS